VADEQGGRTVRAGFPGPRGARCRERRGDADHRSVTKNLEEDHDRRYAGAFPEAHVSTDRRIALLLDVFDQAFDRRAWHGTALWGSVRGLSPREALWRPARRRHNIWEVVLHTAYWKYIVRRRLTRDLELEFPRTGSN